MEGRAEPKGDRVMLLNLLINFNTKTMNTFEGPESMFYNSQKNKPESTDPTDPEKEKVTPKEYLDDDLWNETKKKTSEEGIPLDYETDNTDKRNIILEGLKEETSNIEPGKIPHSECMKKLEEYIVQCGKDTDEIDSLLYDIDADYENSNDQRTREWVKTFKQEALSRAAVENFMLKLPNELARRNINVKIEVEIETSTPEEDESLGMDFWVIVKRKDAAGNDLQFRIPCQVTYINTETYDKKDRATFIKNNYINFEDPNINRMEAKDGKIQEKYGNYLNTFFKGVRETEGKGISFALPTIGNAMPFSQHGQINDKLYKAVMEKAMDPKGAMWSSFIP